MCKLLLLVLCCNIWWTETNSANILYISTTPSPSHNIWDRTLAVALSQNHTVTLFSPTPQEGGKNLTILFIKDVYEKIIRDIPLQDFATYGQFKMLKVLFDWMSASCVYALESPAAKILLEQAKSGSVKYDLILMDLLTGQCLYPFFELFGNPPVIGTSPFGIFQHYSFGFGTDMYTSYLPVLGLPYTSDMTLFQRGYNWLCALFMIYYRQCVIMPEQTRLAEGFFGNQIIPLEEVERNFDLLLSNSDPVLDYPHPTPPNIIHVGGLHTKRAKELPPDLKKIMDDSTHGVILFSLGTNIRADQLDMETRHAIIEALGKLKLTVLWKFESDIDNLPKNVVVRKFLPQNDILAHKNTRLFISHGGALSTQEAMSYGVPIVGIPVFADQATNIQKLVARKLALSLDLHYLTSKDIVSTVNEILNNPVYRNNMKLVSQRYREQPGTALDRALFWVEYTLKNKGAKHFSLPSKNMPFYKYYQLDIIFIFLITICLLVYSVFKLVFRKKIFRKVKLN